MKFHVKIPYDCLENGKKLKQITFSCILWYRMYTDVENSMLLVNDSFVYFLFYLCQFF